MDPINPWLDPIEVRRLAESLIRRAPTSTAQVLDAGFNDAFEGFSADSSRPTATAPPIKLEPAYQSQPSPRYEPKPTTTRGPFLERICYFRDWMHQQFQATEVFMLDREGAVIFDESGHGKLHFLARSLAHASRRPGAPAGNVHVKIGAESTLEVIPVETPYGCLVVGAVVSHSLSPVAVKAIMDAVQKVTSPSNPS